MLSLFDSYMYLYFVVRQSNENSQWIKFSLMDKRKVLVLHDSKAQLRFDDRLTICIFYTYLKAKQSQKGRTNYLAFLKRFLKPLFNLLL